MELRHVQKKADVFSGNRPTRGKSQTSVAWIAFVEETKRMKSINKAILGMVSESLGCNESERTGDPEKPGPRGRALGRRAKAVWTAATD